MQQDEFQLGPTPSLGGSLYRPLILALCRDINGVTALEYGLIAGLIAVAIITAVATLGTDLGAVFNLISTHFTNGTIS